MTESFVLELKGIKKSFGGIHALKGVDFQLRKGEVHALLGENGAGKSTLIKIITGVHQADEGQIIVNGNQTKISSPIVARNLGIAAIYQELSLIETLSVAENIFLGLEPTYSMIGICRKDEIYKKSQAYLDEFGINVDSRKKVSELGMGQKRIVEIVKALAINSQILILDEPTTGMSKAEIDTLFEIMEMLKKKKVTMIYISHYLEEIFRVCTRATVFRDGRNISVFDMNQVTEKELISAMIGKEIRAEKNTRNYDSNGKNVVLKLEQFQTDRMAEPVSLELHEGEIVGVTGIVGAGKSELAHSIFGNAKQKKGRMILNGEEVQFSTPYDTRKHRIAFIPEDRKDEGLFLGDTVANNMIVANIGKFKNRFGLLDGKKKNQVCADMAEKLQVMPMKLDLPVGNLSGGNQQKVVIAKWLTGDPELIIMDEPTRGIDVGAKAEIYHLIRNLADAGKGMLIMSSEFEELINMCDRIFVLYKGKVAGELKSEEASNEKILALSLGGHV